MNARRHEIAEPISRRDWLCQVTLQAGVAGLPMLLGCGRDLPAPAARQSSNAPASAASDEEVPEPHQWRLTLRVLLAYRDRVFTPEEMRAITEQIKANEFAALLYRRLDAAAENDADDEAIRRDQVADASQVANYLDNVMQLDRIADFEIECLKSDARLAELADCHRLLDTFLNSRSSMGFADENRLRARILRETKRAAG